MRVPAQIRGTLLLLIAFAGGVGAGVSYERRQGASPQALATSPHDALHRLSQDLDLDPAQQQAISEILSRHQKDVDVAWHAMQPHVRATMESTHSEIARVLRPEQAAKFQKMIDQLHPGGHR